MAAMRLADRDFADDCDFTQYIFCRIHFVLPAIDDGDRDDRLFVYAMFDDDHYRHREHAIDLASDVGQLASGVVVAGQFDRKEQVGAEQARFDVVVLEQGALARKFLIGELKQQVGRFPLVGKCFVGVEGGCRRVGGDEIQKSGRFGTAKADGAVASVAKR